MAWSQQSSHVPRFGSWDDDNVPFTAYFENARREKSGVKMNPNDPEENPEAFVYGRGGMESDVDFSFAQSTPLHHKSTWAEKHHIEGHRGHNLQRRNPSNCQKIASHRSITSEFARDKSNSDYSPLQVAYRHEKSTWKTGIATDGSTSLSTSVVSQHYRQRSGTHPSDDGVSLLSNIL